MLAYIHSFKLRNVHRTGSGRCTHYDIHQFISGLNMLATHMVDCSELFLVILYVSAAVHSWPRWSLALFSRWCYRVLASALGLHLANFCVCVS